MSRHDINRLFDSVPNAIRTLQTMVTYAYAPIYRSGLSDAEQIEIGQAIDWKTKFSLLHPEYLSAIAQYATRATRHAYQCIAKLFSATLYPDAMVSYFGIFTFSLTAASILITISDMLKVIATLCICQQTYKHM